MKPQILILILLLFSCIEKESDKKNTNDIESKHSILQPICVVANKVKEYKKVYGKELKVNNDSLKIEFEYKGDTTIQKRIDVKGIKDDNWDNSFTVQTIWSTKVNSNLDCKKKIGINIRNLNYYFCVDDALELIESETSDPDNWYKLKGLNKAKQILLRIKNGESNTIYKDEFGEYLVEKLIKKLKFTICNTKSVNQISFARIGKFYTGFSAGYEYLIIDSKNDTIEKMLRTEVQF
ncbi:hypothetical protein [Winogradskyella rapida]|uniref:Uncharacterized protein n=1 Tax=Winogradskyella rapida TaxID=549701 RepID=A0ABW3KRX9_9FLAO